MNNIEILIDFIRKESIYSEEKKVNAIKSKNGEEFSKGYHSGHSSAYYKILRFMVEEMGLILEPDLSLIIEAEGFITKYPGSFICGHELNRSLHHYRGYFKEKDYIKAIVSEVNLRTLIIKARLESLRGLELTK